MRITTIGSGNPPVRRGQASTSWLVELGNGDYFIIDAGGGTTANDENAHVIAADERLDDVLARQFSPSLCD